MKLQRDLEAEQWISDFIPYPENFDWDEGNIRKNQKHDVSQKEIESLLQQSEIVFAGRIIEPLHDEWRGLILGMNEND